MGHILEVNTLSNGSQLAILYPFRPIETQLNDGSDKASILEFLEYT